MTAKEALRQRRKLGMTQRELGAALGIERAAIARRELGLIKVRPWYVLACEMLRARQPGRAR